MKKAFTYLFPLLLALAAQASFAQGTKVSGNIVDDETGEPLVGVNVLVKDKPSIGTITDFDGNYSLTVPDGYSVILFRYIGYSEKELDITLTSDYSISLASSAVSLDKVTVTAGRRAERALDAPASISLIESEEIQNRVVATPSEYVANSSGVDVMRTGLVASNVVIRGFNNIFSGQTLTLVDNRRASVPSLRVNSAQMIPNTPGDIQRIEVLKGPASAMYGPSSSNGVVHMITESPLDMKERFRTTISQSAGIRSRWEKGDQPVDIVNLANPVYDDGKRWASMTDLRHAGDLTKNKVGGVKVGYKISGKFMRAYDWKYDDPEEADSLIFRRQSPNGIDTVGTEYIHNPRTNEITNWGTEGRLDIRFPKKVELIFSGGLNNFSGIELTGLGAGMGQDWRYGFGQVRLIWKDLFAQFYVNTSNAGDTYLLRSGNLIVDNSKFYNGQIQHGVQLWEDKLKLIYGFDALLTRPNTDGTIHGNYEDDDNINELGAYLQGDWQIAPKLNFIAAVRGDYHTFVDGIFISPRAALVYKPSFFHSLRLTYNRAFDSPSALNSSLDINESPDVFGYTSLGLPSGIDVRAIGNRNGHFFNRNDSGIPRFRSPFAPFAGGTPADFYDLGDTNMTGAVYGVVVGGLAQALKDAGFPGAIVDNIVDKIVADVDLSGTAHAVREFTLNPADPFTEPISTDLIQDVPVLKHSVTQTGEVGYKGIINNKLSITADVYVTHIQDFTSPLYLITPSVFVDGSSLGQVLADQIGANMANPDNAVEAGLVTGLLDTADEVAGIAVNGNGNGSGTDELVNILASQVAGIPFGTITPTSINDPSFILTYRNFGDVTLWGFETGVNYFITDEIKVGANYSFVSKDEFETEGIKVNLNSPRHKTSLLAGYTSKKLGLDVSARWRWQATFNANSGVYVGEVPKFNQLDLTVGYRLPFSKDTHISMSVQNLLNDFHIEFPGTPQMGAFALFRLSHTFKNE